MKRRKVRQFRVEPWIAGGLFLMAIAVLFDPRSIVISGISRGSNRGCQAVLQPTATITRQQLAQLLATPERSPREQVRALLKEPYCKFESIKVRAGVTAERDVYPLDFDAQTWLVVLYEDDEYAGYRFSVR